MKTIFMFCMLLILGFSLSLQSFEVQAQGSTLGRNQGQMTVAYCWRNQSDYYFCYGPVQLTSSGETLELALQYSGCTDPDPQEYWPSTRGVLTGVWHICQGRKMENYHNSEEQIRQWLNRR